MTNEIEHRYKKIEESPDKLRELAEESLKNIQKIIREGLKRGRKPEIEEDIVKNVKEVIEEVLNQPENNVLIEVLPQYREKVRTYLLMALSNIAAELKRRRVLDTSIFTDRTKLALLAEMLIINYVQIAWYISKKLPFPQSILEKAQRIATYHDYEFIDKFFNDDENLAQQLNITPEEAKELFPRWLRLHFAAYYISNPLEALKRVKEHLETTLTDENLAQQLNITPEEARELFPRWLRLYFAVNNISNPLEALKRWLKKEISTPYDYKREEMLKVIENR